MILICVVGEIFDRVIVRYLPTIVTFHPEGIPFSFVDHPSKPAALTNVPLEATPDNQLDVQSVAVISVARQVTFCKFEHPPNIVE